MSFINSLESHISKISKPSMENPVYITTNETGLDQARKILTDMPPSANGAHIGVSGWHNFDIMAIRKSKHGILVDINKNQSVFNLVTLNKIINSKDRKDFINQMFETLQKIEQFTRWNSFFQVHVNDDQPDILTPSEQLANEPSRIGSWLYDDESFEYIKQMAIDDRIFIAAADFQDTSFFEAIGKTLQTANISTDTLYTSNIHDYILPANAEKFKGSVKALSQEKTQHIYANRRDGLVQTVRKNTEPFDEVFGDATFVKDDTIEDDNIRLGMQKLALIPIHRPRVMRRYPELTFSQ